MDKFILEFLKLYETKNNHYADTLPTVVHNNNINYFKVLNYNSKINIFDMLSIKVSFYGGEITIKENNSNIKHLRKGSKLLSINDKYPLSKFDNCNLFKIRINQKICNNLYVEKVLYLDVPIFDFSNDNYKIEINNNTLYIRISSFYNGQFEKINIDFDAFYEKVIIDLRDNNGGLLSDMINLLNFFIDYGDHIMTLDILEDKYTVHSKSSQIIKYNKIYVIVNNNTYSSAEIFTHVLYNKLGAKIIGSNMAGKLNVIKIYEVEGLNYMVPIGSYIKQKELKIIRISNKIIDTWLDKLL